MTNRKKNVTNVNSIKHNPWNFVTSAFCSKQAGGGESYERDGEQDWEGGERNVWSCSAVWMEGKLWLLCFGSVFCVTALNYTHSWTKHLNYWAHYSRSSIQRNTYASINKTDYCEENGSLITHQYSAKAAKWICIEHRNTKCIKAKHRPTFSLIFSLTHSLCIYEELVT